MLTLIKRTLLILVLVILALLFMLSSRAPDPEIWHEVELEEEFTRNSNIASFADYLALEDRLFAELQEKVYAETPRGPDHRFERYSTGSAADPTQRSTNWNRSFELGADNPRGAVLLLHGMSDSPYSLRAIGLALNAGGYRVLGLRVPGHGTIPSGLKHVHWRDMAEATTLAMQHLAAQLDGGPIHIIGYSTGAALALDYALNAEADGTLQKPASLVLMSPAIGVSPAAALAQWNRRFSNLPGLGGLAWLDIMPEFDPYKYNSFATNAAEQVRNLTVNVSSRITARDPATASPLPPILVLKSTVDATTSTSAVVDSLLAKLSTGRHEYVLFDINRRGANASIIVSDPGPVTDQLVKNAALPFALTVVGNQNAQGTDVVARSKAPLTSELGEEVALGVSWPTSTLSLSHIALPFPPDDPLYGVERPDNDNEIFLGLVAIQGERGLLRFSADWLIRIRHNPFYDYTLQRIEDWLNASAPVERPGES